MENGEISGETGALRKRKYSRSGKNYGKSIYWLEITADNRRVNELGKSFDMKHKEKTGKLKRARSRILYSK